VWVVPFELLRSLRSLRADRAGKPPTSSSLADEKRVGSFLLSTAPRDPGICQRPLFQYLIRADFI
jgi:hypothetical protein